MSGNREAAAEKNRANKSRYHGLTWLDFINSWQVNIWLDGQRYINTYLHEIEAAIAYDDTAAAIMQQDPTKKYTLNFGLPNLPQTNDNRANAFIEYERRYFKELEKNYYSTGGGVGDAAAAAASSSSAAKSQRTDATGDPTESKRLKRSTATDSGAGAAAATGPITRAAAKAIDKTTVTQATAAPLDSAAAAKPKSSSSSAAAPTDNTRPTLQDDIASRIIDKFYRYKWIDPYTGQLIEHDAMRRFVLSLKFSNQGMSWHLQGMIEGVLSDIQIYLADEHHREAKLQFLTLLNIYGNKLTALNFDLLLINIRDRVRSGKFVLVNNQAAFQLLVMVTHEFGILHYTQPGVVVPYFLGESAPQADPNESVQQAALAQSPRISHSQRMAQSPRMLETPRMSGTSWGLNSDLESNNGSPYLPYSTFSSPRAAAAQLGTPDSNFTLPPLSPNFLNNLPDTPQLRRMLNLKPPG